MYLMNILIVNNRVRTPFRFSHSLFFSLSFFFSFFSLARILSSFVQFL